MGKGVTFRLKIPPENNWIHRLNHLLTTAKWWQFKKLQKVFHCTESTKKFLNALMAVCAESKEQWYKLRIDFKTDKNGDVEIVDFIRVHEIKGDEKDAD